MESGILDLHDSIRAQVYAQIPAAREKGLVLDLILEMDSPRWIGGAAADCARGVAALVRKAIEETPRGGVSVRLESAPGPENAGTEDRERACALVVVRGAGPAQVLPIAGRPMPAPGSRGGAGRGGSE